MLHSYRGYDFGRVSTFVDQIKELEFSNTGEGTL